MEPVSKNETFHPGEPPARIAGNFLWLTWSGAISIANSLLVWIFMARMRDVDEVGRFTIVMGLYALFYSIVSLGLMPYLVHEISRRVRLGVDSKQSISKLVSSSSIFLLLSGIVFAGLMTASGFGVSSSGEVHLSTLSLSLALIPTGMIMVAEANAIAYGHARLVAGVTTVENILRTVIPLGLIWLGSDIFLVCLSFAAVRYVAFAIYSVNALFYGGRFGFDAHEFRALISICPAFAGTIIFASINWQAALVMLGYLGTEAESAAYGAASRFLVPVAILMSSYANAIQPMIAECLQNDPSGLGNYLSRKARLPLLVAMTTAIVSPFLSGYVLTLLFGSSYARSAGTLDVLALSIIPFCLVVVVARGLVATGSQSIDMYANILGVIVCIAACLILIPRYGAIGAAGAQLLSFLSMAIVEIAYLSRKTQGFSIWRTASVSSASLLIIYLVLWKQ